jgi:hypothetical protein
VWVVIGLAVLLGFAILLGIVVASKKGKRGSYLDDDDA